MRFVTIPNHLPLKTGNLLGGILKPAAAHHKLTVEELPAKLELLTRRNHRKC